MSGKKSVNLIKLVVLLLLFSSLVTAIPVQAFKRVDEGSEAPAFTLETTTASKISLKDYSGKVVALCFWKFGQKSEAELTALQQSYLTLESKGLEVLAIYIPISDDNVTEQEIKDINKLVADKALSFPILIDKGMSVFSTYGVITMPSLAVIDKKGKIASLYSGFPKFGGDKQVNSRLEAALGMAKKVVKKEEKGYQPKGRAGFFYKFGMRFFNLGFMDKAAEKLELSLKEDPDYPKAHLLLAQIYAKKGKKDQASTAFNLAIVADPEDLEIHRAYGDFCVKQKMFDEALIEFETVKALDPKSGAGDQGLGDLYFAQKNYEEAEKAYLDAIDLYTGKGKKKGNLLGMLKQRKAQKTNPDIAPAYYGLARTQVELNKKDAALKTYDNSVKSYQQFIEQLLKEAAEGESEKK